MIKDPFKVFMFAIKYKSVLSIRSSKEWLVERWTNSHYKWKIIEKRNEHSITSDLSGDNFYIINQSGRQKTIFMSLFAINWVGQVELAMLSLSESFKKIYT